MNERLAILAGGGVLPLLLQEKLRDASFFVFCGIKHKLKGSKLTEVRFERLGDLISHLKKKQITHLILAGSIHRPKLDLNCLDNFSKQLFTKLHGTCEQGDNSLLGVILSEFEEEGFEITGVTEVLPDLTAPKGILVGAPVSSVAVDITKADQVLRLTGEADIGQAVVIENGIVLGIETLQGTDFLLKFVAATKTHLRSENKGILVKRPKLGQDLRVDMPTIGPNTIKLVKKAKLAGIVISPEKGIILEKEKTLGLAQKLGVFVLSKKEMT